ncbi:MAG: hypothetical protein JW814_00595 [Candidatus Krumholzibacteriota bacterium]|nr:hypothetical protein [Candidatus Krumholzibacteriota bacterium]
MKKALMMVIALAMLAGAANAGPIAYMALYADHGRTVQEAIFVPPFVNFHIYVYCLPSDNGVTALEYQVALDGTTNLVALAGVKNPAMGIADGAPYGAPGIKVSCPCQGDWFYTFDLPFYLMDGVAGYVELVAHDLIETQVQVAGCDALRTIEPVTPLNKFGLNQDGVVANETSTWGAIKSLINE